MILTMENTKIFLLIEISFSFVLGTNKQLLRSKRVLSIPEVNPYIIPVTHTLLINVLRNPLGERGKFSDKLMLGTVFTVPLKLPSRSWPGTHKLLALELL